MWNWQAQPRGGARIGKRANWYCFVCLSTHDLCGYRGYFFSKIVTLSREILKSDVENIDFELQA